jgi:hypothetical protein
VQYRSGAKLGSSRMGSGGGPRSTTVTLGGGAAIFDPDLSGDANTCDAFAATAP